MVKPAAGIKKPRKGGGAAAPLKILPALTKKQSECLLFIFNYYAEHRHFPTHREIARAMGSTSATAAMYIDPLVEKGYLKRASKGKTARNIRVTVDGLERLRMMGVSVQL
jgi:DNA-binding MarR family transcriptional regulator